MERNLNALQAIILALIIAGALSLQFFKHEQPCPLCLIQRLGMICVGASALLNVRFGPQKKHYGLAIISALFGAFVALRQIAFHVCPGFPKFGVPFWGLSLYTWSFIIFVTSLAYNGILLFFFKTEKPLTGMNWFGHVAFWLLIIIALLNVAGTLAECGFGPCVSP